MKDLYNDCGPNDIGLDAHDGGTGEAMPLIHEELSFRSPRPGPCLTRGRLAISAWQERASEQLQSRWQ